MRKLRYGRIAYVNVAPIETAFDAGAVTRDADVVVDVPTRLNAALLAGELDVAAISAAHYLEHRDSLELVGDLCIAADGPVRSVLLLSPVPPALLGGASIAVTAQSATGKALLATLLEKLQRVQPTYDVVDDALAAAANGRPALVIGDDALVARKICRPACIYDLGEAWHTWTGLPFVFAVWAVRREVLAARPGRRRRARRGARAGPRVGQRAPRRGRRRRARAGAVPPRALRRLLHALVVHARRPRAARAGAFRGPS